MPILKFLPQILFYFAAEQKQNNMDKINFITQAELLVGSLCLKKILNVSGFNSGQEGDPPVPVPPKK